MTGAETVDFVVVGSGAAGLVAALAAAAGGLAVVILEKTDCIGGTSAMSGAGTWIPANHHAREAGIADSQAEALAYLRSASPDGWAAQEDYLWRAFVATAPAMLEFVERNTRLRYALTDEADPMAEHEGGKLRGRMVSPRVLSRRITGQYARKLRRSTLPQRFTYQELRRHDVYHHPIRAGLAMLPQLAARLLTDSVGQGGALIAGLLRGCLDKGCRIELGAEAERLLQDADGRVTGVALTQRGVARSIQARRGVLLATGGFEWDAARREAHFPGPSQWHGSPRSNTGDGQRMAEAAGAALDRMDQANVYPTLPTAYEGRLHGMPYTWQSEPNAILVNRNGERFVSEYDYNVGEALDRRAPDGTAVNVPAWLIADHRFLARSLPFRRQARRATDWIRQADSLAALARVAGLPETALAATVARFNGFCATGKDLDFHRGETAWERGKAPGKRGGDGNPSLGAIEHPPFIAIPFHRSILGTKGGARTDDRARALRPDGSVIEGLLCAGLAMANPIGTRAVGAGTTIGPNMTWGYIAAATVLGNRAQVS